MENIIVEIGNNIKTLRKNAGLTQAQLAEKINVDSKYISRLETGSSTASIATISKLAGALGVEVKELFKIENIKNKNNMIKSINQELSKLNTKDLEAVYLMIRALVEKYS